MARRLHESSAHGPIAVMKLPVCCVVVDGERQKAPCRPTPVIVSISSVTGQLRIAVFDVADGAGRLFDRRSYTVIFWRRYNLVALRPLNRGATADFFGKCGTDCRQMLGEYKIGAAGVRPSYHCDLQIG